MGKAASQPSAKAYIGRTPFRSPQNHLIRELTPLLRKAFRVRDDSAILGRKHRDFVSVSCGRLARGCAHRERTALHRVSPAEGSLRQRPPCRAAECVRSRDYSQE
jgi:hypothetical protein